MSFWFEKDRLPTNFTPAGGISTLSDIMEAAKEHSTLVENSTAGYEALDRAYEDRIRAIREATGQTVANPMRRASEAEQDPALLQPGMIMLRDTKPEIYEQKAQEFADTLAILAEKYPDAAGVVRPGVRVENDAHALARHADEHLANAMASRPGLGKWAAAIAGGFTGSLRDPMQTATLIVGGGPGAGRTVAARIASAALKEALVNGAAEAIFQPQVQAWRQEAGLPNGFDEGLRNVMFAAGTAGVLGGSVQGLGEIAARAFRAAPVETAAAALRDSGKLRTDVAEALAGNPERSIEVLRPIREALPAEARGAIDQADASRIISDTRPAQANAAVHEANVTAALRAAQDGTPFVPEADPDQVARIVERLVPPPAAAAKGEQSLQQFLISAGGVRDYKGELEALGLSGVYERFRGRLVREDGIPLDDARRAAAEAGYFSGRYGTPEEAMEKSTIADLLDELDTGSRSADAPAIDDGGRAYAEGMVSDLVARAGPNVKDDLIVEAAELANREGIAPAEALDRVLIADDAAVRAREVAARALDPTDRTGGIDDPAAISDPDMLISRADLETDDDAFEIPFFDDDRLASPEAIMDEITRLEDLTAIVEACRL